LRLSIPSLVGNANLIKKIYFPREVLPLGTVIVSIIDFCIAFVILIGLVVFYKYSGRYDVPLTPYLLLMPVILFVQLVLTLGITFFFSAVNVTYRDVKHTVPLLLQLWMFASPVIYSANGFVRAVRGGVCVFQAGGCAFRGYFVSGDNGKPQRHKGHKESKTNFGGNDLTKVRSEMRNASLPYPWNTFAVPGVLCAFVVCLFRLRLCGAT